MFRKIHFAAQDPIYKQLIEALVPFEDQLKYKFSVNQNMLEKVICKVWKAGLSRKMKDRLRIFIRNNSQRIMEHIAALKENKDCVIIHRSLEIQQRFFESVTQAMIPYKELLASSLPVPRDILKIVADCLDEFHLGNSTIRYLKNYLKRKKAAVLRRISELSEKNYERNESSMPEVEIVAEIKVVTYTVTSPFKNYQIGNIKDTEVESLQRPKSLLHRKRRRELEEIEETEIIDEERSPCRKRRHLAFDTMVNVMDDDLAFARWCLNKIRPIFGT